MKVVTLGSLTPLCYVDPRKLIPLDSFYWILSAWKIFFFFRLRRECCFYCLDLFWVFGKKNSLAIFFFKFLTSPSQIPCLFNLV
jgi:hypothetical protein